MLNYTSLPTNNASEVLTLRHYRNVNVIITIVYKCHDGHATFLYCIVYIFIYKIVTTDILGALFYSPVDFTDASDLNTLMQV